MYICIAFFKYFLYYGVYEVITVGFSVKNYAKKNCPWISKKDKGPNGDSIWAGNNFRRERASRCRPRPGEGPNERRPGPGDVTTSDCVTFTMRRWCHRARRRITWPKNIDSVPHTCSSYTYTYFRRVLFYCWIDRLCARVKLGETFTTIHLFNFNPLSRFSHIVRINHADQLCLILPVIHTN